MTYLARWLSLKQGLPTILSNKDILRIFLDLVLKLFQMIYS